MTKQLASQNKSPDAGLNVAEAQARLQQVQYRLFALFVERRQHRDKATPTRIQSYVLERVRASELLFTSQIADILTVSRPTASQMVNTMVERGWLTRDVKGSDRRRQAVRLTEQGVEVIERQSQRRKARLEAILGALDASERTVLVRLAERVEGLWTTMEHTMSDDEGSPPKHGRQ